MYSLFFSINALVKLALWLAPVLLVLWLPYHVFHITGKPSSAIFSALVPWLLALGLELAGLVPTNRATKFVQLIAGILAIYFLAEDYERLYRQVGIQVGNQVIAFLPIPQYLLIGDRLLLGSIIFVGATTFLLSSSRLQAWKSAAIRRDTRTAHGSAEWMSNEVAKREAFAVGDLVVGKLTDSYKPRAADLLRANGSGHLIFVAGSGSGKTTSIAIPNCMTWQSNIVSTDPKGEIFRATRSKRKALNQLVLHISPDDRETFSINVMDWLDPSDAGVVEDVDALISWLDASDESAIGGGSGKGENASFHTNAKSLIKTAILAVLYHPSIAPHERNLVTVRKVLTGRNLRKNLQELAEQPDDFSFGVVQQYANQLLAIAESDRTWSGVVAHVEELTSWLSTPTLSTLVVGNSKTPSIETIVRGKFDVFINIPLKTIDSTPAIARVLLGSLLNGVYEKYLNDEAFNERTLFLIDEMPRLKYMKLLETARDAGRGHGLTLLAIVQDLGQLEKYYGKPGVKSWIESSEIRGFFGINDIETAEYISKSLGNRTVETETESVSHGHTSNPGKFLGSRTETSTYTRGLVGKPLLAPSEITQLPTDKNGSAKQQILLRRGYPPLRCDLAKYYEIEDFSCVVVEEIAKSSTEESGEAPVELAAPVLRRRRSRPSRQRPRFD